MRKLTPEGIILIIATTIFIGYWGYVFLFQPTRYLNRTFIGEDGGGVWIWKIEKSPAPIPRFIEKHKEELTKLMERVGKL